MKKITMMQKIKFKNFNPKIKEECGVFGISNNNDASALTALGLHALQHRGQEGCGIVSFDGDQYHSEKRFGLVGDNFNKEKVLKNLTGKYAIGIIKELITKDLPVFGICLGHQILGLALGAKTKKMKLGHRGANHPVKNLIENKVEITSQNHGFEIIRESLPKNIQVTHTSLFDNSIEGIRLKNKPVFSVQYHPESNPGPQDSVYLFQEFINNMKKNAKKKRS